MTLDSKTDTKQTRRALGRGLASLLPELDDTNNEINTDNKAFFMCDIDKLIPSTQQPRKIFDDTRIHELAESIKELGVIQALIVRRRGDKYEIVAGERRWRASKLAGLKQVPVILKEMTDRVTLQTALVENIQRADLNPIEEAKAYKQLLEEYNMTQDELAKKIGRERSSVTNYIRLLRLPEDIQNLLVKGDINTGHAKILCGLDNEKLIRQTAESITKKELSVRDTEKLVTRLLSNRKSNKNTKKEERLFDTIEDNLREKFSTKVHVKGKYEQGAFVIEYFSKDDFERILSILFE